MLKVKERECEELRREAREVDRLRKENANLKDKVDALSKQISNLSHLETLNQNLKT
jgi:hypothetical protein